MFQSVLLLIVSCLISQCISSISPGRCPYIEPIEHFEMLKFLGRWYAIQETSTKSSCMTYDFLEGSRSGEYLMEQSSEGYVKSLNVSYKVSYAGKLTVPDSNACNKMTVTYPLIRLMGTILFEVITTDYETYAAVTTCQNVLWLLKRQTTTFLSRTKHISEETLEKIKSKVQSQKISNPLLKSVSHVSCLAEKSRELFKINSNPSVRVYESVANPVENVEENLRKVYFSSGGDPDLDFLNNNDIASIVGGD
ncbi:hypothetical protein HA402_009067 [Bradysia odoriphaga]|nr:hypothetical protein HA402_009067 [Bradysia odoriphaga]